VHSLNISPGEDNMKHTSGDIGRRAVLKSAAMVAVAASASAQNQAPAPPPATTLADVPLGPAVTVTVERRGDIVLVGLNRQSIFNRIDPPTRLRLGEVFYQYEHDPTLRAAIMFGHGPHFSRGIDVDASQAVRRRSTTSATPPVRAARSR
jgi:hypothetical protein